MKKKVLAAAILGLGAISSTAVAGLVVEQRKSAQQVSVEAAPAEKRELEASKPKKDAHLYRDGSYRGEVVNGFGRDVSLSEAATQIIPPTWRLSVSGDIDDVLSRRVNWKGGQPWVDLLQSTFRNTGVAVVVTVDSKEVSLQNERALEASLKGYTFQLFPTDKSLRTAFARWASQAGYQFYWDAPREIPNSGMYYATKKDIEGALMEVLAAVNEDSDLQLGAYIHEVEGQRVIRITKFIKEAAK